VPLEVSELTFDVYMSRASSVINVYTYIHVGKL
jgi:hypothetical protein